MVRRQHTEAVALDLQSTVESRAKIFQRDRGCQFDDLFGAEDGLYLLKDSIRNLGRNPSHLLGIAQRRLFTAIEIRAGLEDRQILQLLVCDTGLPAYGRVDIDSKRTAHHLRRAHGHHGLQTSFDDSRGADRLPQFCRSDQNLRPVSHNKIGRNDTPEETKTSLKHRFYVLGCIFGIDSLDSHFLKHLSSMVSIGCVSACDYTLKGRWYRG